MSKISYTKYFFLLLLCIPTFTECKKEESNSLSHYCGSYYPDNIYWTGEIVDFNGDGIGTREMLDEFFGYPGFVKEWIKGNVQLLDNTTISFDSVIPVCVKYDSIEQPDIKYYDVAIESTWRADWGRPGFSTETFKPGAADVMNGIERAIVYNITYSSFELHVDCSLYSQEKGLVQGTMIYYFKKQNQ